MKFPRVHKVSAPGPIKVYEVDGLWVRHNLDPDFNNFGSWPRFAFIPKDEFWLDKELDKREYSLYLVNLQAERKALLDGASEEDAASAGDIAEEAARNDHTPLRPFDVYPDVKKRRLKTLPNGVEVWLVDGEKVRDWLSVDFVSGGHDLVYDWIPKGEIWIDDAVLEQERPLVMTHEALERSLMEHQGLSYEEAHEQALQAEHRQYVTENGKELSERHLGMYIRFRGAVYRRAASS